MMIHDDPGLALAHSVTHQTGEKRITTAKMWSQNLRLIDKDILPTARYPFLVAKVR